MHVSLFLYTPKLSVRKEKTEGKNCKKIIFFGCLVSVFLSKKCVELVLTFM